MRRTIPAAFLLLAACADSADEAPGQEAATPVSQDHAGTDHGNMDHDGMEHAADAAMPDGLAMGEGRVVSLPGDRRVRIDHGPIEAVGMGAMTMTFEAKASADLGGIDAGDEVHFLLDRGRDGTLRLEAICDTGAADHAACMDAMRTSSQAR